jgi:hypothetical protein
MTFRKAFYQELISPVLFELWRSANSKSKETISNYRPAWLILLGLGNGLLVFVPKEQVAFLIFGVIILTVSGLLYQDDPERTFLKDSTKLVAYLPRAALVDSVMIQKYVDNFLIGCAEEICLLEDRGQQLSGMHEALTKRLGNGYDVFKRFGLTDKRGYEAYFVHARQNITNREKENLGLSHKI